MFLTEPVLCAFLPAPRITLAVIEGNDLDLVWIDPVVQAVRETPNDHAPDARRYFPICLRQQSDPVESLLDTQQELLA